MKMLNDMTRDERLDFLQLGARVAADILKDHEHRDAPLAETVVMTTVFVKSWNRPLLNLHVEYGVDRELFVRDAVEQTGVFFTNMVALLRDPKADDVFERHRIARREVEFTIQQTELKAKMAVELLRDPLYQQLVRDAFAELFADLKEQGKL